jgi:hypothetical protein
MALVAGFNGGSGLVVKQIRPFPGRNDLILFFLKAGIIYRGNERVIVLIFQ